MRLPEIHKTAKMRLLEQIDPHRRDVRLIVREAMVDGRTLKRAAELLNERYDVDLDRSTLHVWTTEWHWSSERFLVTPGLPKVKVA